MFLAWMGGRIVGCIERARSSRITAGGGGVFRPARMCTVRRRVSFPLAAALTALTSFAVVDARPVSALQQEPPLVIPDSVVETSTAGPTTTVPSSTTTTVVATKRVVEIVGHGYGHGRGLGQWGAYGYAVDKGWGYRKILAHYYGGTAVGKVSPQSAIGVRLSAMDDKVLTVFHQQGRLLTGLDGQGGNLPPAAVSLLVAQALAAAPAAPAAPAASAAPAAPAGSETGWSSPSTPGNTLASLRLPPSAIRIKLVSAGTFAIADGPTCAGPWTERPLVQAKSVSVSAGPLDAALPAEDPGQLLQICDGATRRLYRGDLVAFDGQPGQRTVNQLGLDDYLRSVVPAEVPRSWGSTEQGKEALRAQAVAARSYASAERRTGFSNTCDTTSCQVYRGRGEIRNGALTSFEDSRTDQAVADTAFEIRVDPSTGVPIRTEFSSSTGGHTARGDFPPVVDEGDATAPNPYKNWNLTVPASKLESGRGLGTLLGIDMTRDGSGPDGGRVQQVQLTFSKGAASMTGGELASKLGLRSSLFTATLRVVPIDAPVKPADTLPDEGEPLTDVGDGPATLPASTAATTTRVTVAKKGETDTTRPKVRRVTTTTLTVRPRSTPETTKPPKPPK